MTTIDFVQNMISWLAADPTHIVAAAALLNSIIPTPDPATPAGKIYKVLELLALSFLRAKETGIPPQSPAALADQIAEAIAKKSVPAPTPGAPSAPTQA
jgi:hypothetical protein